MSRRAELAARVEAGQEEGGLNFQELVETCHAAYRAARAGFGEHVTEEMGDCPGEYIEGLAAAVAAGRAMLFEAEASEGASASTWKDGAMRVCHELGIGEPGDPDVLCAEALLRHLTNALDFDPEDDGDLAEHAAGWKEWTSHQAERLRGSQTES